MKAKKKEKPEDAPSPPPEKILYDNRIKRKNVLALNEKVAAIKEYEKMPVYKRIGRMFHCSPDQIKRIVQQKDQILKAWEQRTRRCQDAKTLDMKVVRVSMLGKAVYEWIRRMMYYNDFTISDGLIQKQALQFKSAMGLQTFFPHQDWVDKFRQTYKINENDSKLLNIGYSQGYSVQIKDVIKDVLNECLPDGADATDDDIDDEEDELGRENEFQTQSPATKTIQPDKKLTLKPRIAVRNPNEMSARAMPQLQPISQLLALPIKTNGVGRTQKVLVATPITPAAPASQRSGAPPITMTIIPFATIAQSQAQSQSPTQAHTSNAQSTGSHKPATVPLPMVTIKKEIKDENEDEVEVEVVRIKQERLSDDEYEMPETQNPQNPTNQGNVADVVTTAVAAAAANKATTTRPTTPVAKSDRKEQVPTADDYDDLTLSSLRRLIHTEDPTSSKNVSTTTNSAMGNPNATPSNRSSDAKAIKMQAVATAANCSTTPPLPPLTRAPILSRLANKRKHRVDCSPSLPPIKTFAEARRYLKLLEDFALVKENYRLIGLVTRADEVLRELDGNDDVDVD